MFGYTRLWVRYVGLRPDFYAKPAAAVMRTMYNTRYKGSAWENMYQCLWY